MDDAAADAVRRVRTRSAGWWRTPSARPGRTRAEVVAHLAGEVARLGLALEGEPPRPLPPPVREAVLADQLAVVTYDLVLALRETPDERTAAVALAELLVHAHDVDPRRLPDDAAAAVLALLHPHRLAGLPEGAAPGDLLLVVEGGPDGRHDEPGGA